MRTAVQPRRLSLSLTLSYFSSRLSSWPRHTHSQSHQQHVVYPLSAHDDRNSARTRGSADCRNGQHARSVSSSSAKTPSSRRHTRQAHAQPHPEPGPRPGARHGNRRWHCHGRRHRRTWGIRMRERARRRRRSRVCDATVRSWQKRWRTGRDGNNNDDDDDDNATRIKSRPHSRAAVPARK